MDDLVGFVSPARWVGHPTVIKAITASTNDDARVLAGTGCGAGTLVVADTQTAGRGRRGRTWQSPAGENLYLSLVLRPQSEPGAMAPLPLVIGLAVAEALADFTDGSRVALKWPNDVRVEGRKLCGVLVESSMGHGVLTQVVVGIGINVRGEAPPPGLESTATTLRELRGGRDLSRAEVLAAVLRALEQRLETFDRQGFHGALHAAVTARCETLGTRVTGDGVTGVAVAIGPDGALTLRTDEGVHVDLRAGDVTPVTSPANGEG